MNRQAGDKACHHLIHITQDLRTKTGVACVKDTGRPSKMRAYSQLKVPCRPTPLKALGDAVTTITIDDPILNMVRKRF